MAILTAAAQAKLHKVKWEGCAQKLKRDVLDAVEKCAGIPDKDLIHCDVGRLPQDIRHSWWSLRIKGEDFLQVTEIVMGVYESARRAEEQAEMVRDIDRRAALNAGKGDSKDDNRGSRNRQHFGSRGGYDSKGYSRNRSSGTRAAGTRPFRLSPCRNCGIVGHLSQDCANLKRTKAPANTQCFACGGRGHYKRECVPYQALNEEVQQNAATPKAQTPKAATVKQEQTAAKSAVTKGNSNTMCGDVQLCAEGGHGDSSIYAAPERRIHKPQKARRAS